MPRRQTNGDKPSKAADEDTAEETSQQPTLPNTDFKIRILPGHSEDLTAVTFQIHDEDHTLGNALRYIIMKKFVYPVVGVDVNGSPDVEFCGYSIPHPSEPKLNLRIQTYGEDGKTAVDALEKGLDDLMALCQVVEDKFRVAVDEKKSSMDID